MHFFVPLLIFPLLFSCVQLQTWDYENQDQWPDTCKGKRQSPINIVTRDVRPVNFEKINYDRNFRKELKAQIVNTGHTVRLQLIDESAKPTISGGCLKAKYVLEEWHFHWGSEHTIDTKRNDLEGHFVFYAGKYNNFGEAVTHEDGIAVFATFYTICKNDNKAFDNIIRSTDKIAKRRNQNVPLDAPVTIADFFPKNVQTYYRYNGSLTTPNCNEVVTWTLFSEPSCISQTQLDNLTQIYGENNTLIKYNYRNAQDLNGRRVYFQKYSNNKETGKCIKI